MFHHYLQKHNGDWRSLVRALKQCSDRAKGPRVFWDQYKTDLKYKLKHGHDCQSWLLHNINDIKVRLTGNSRGWSTTAFGELTENNRYTQLNNDDCVPASLAAATHNLLHFRLMCDSCFLFIVVIPRIRREEWRYIPVVKTSLTQNFVENG